MIGARFKNVALVISLSFSAMLLPHCSSNAPSSRPTTNPPLIVISIDTLRSDRLGCYGYSEARTPHLDKLSEESILFERAYTVCPLTLPAHSTMMTGTLPTEHGVRDNRGFALDEEQSTLAEILRNAGYRTGGFISSMVLRSSTGIARGFESWDDEMSANTSETFAQRRGDLTLERAVDWLMQPDDTRPPFLFMHLYDPHSPYDAPAPWDQGSDPYDSEIAWTDSLIGQFMEVFNSSPLADRAWLVVVSDHGEGLGDHVEQEHGLLLYRETLQVPLIIRPPGGIAAARREEPVSLVDLMPSLLERLGLTDDTERAWFSKIYQPSGLYAETMFPKFQYGFSPLRSAIRGDLQYIEAPRPELYDLKRDPQSRDNLIQRRSPPPSLLDIISRAGDGRESEATIDDAESAALASLGYVGGAETEPGDTLDDPKDRVVEVEQLFALAKLVGKSPSDDVEQQLVQLMHRLNIRNESLATTLSNNLIVNGELLAAEQILEPFIAMPSPAVGQLLGQIELERGNLARAQDHFNAVLAKDPLAARAQMGLGMIGLSLGKINAAGAAFDRALALDDRLVEAWNGRAIVNAQNGRWTEAISSWRHAVELDETLADAWYNLSIALAQQGELEAAAEAQRQFERLR